jgi:hypothetical protein
MPHARATSTIPGQDRRSRSDRWRCAVAELTMLQQEYENWLLALPDSLQESSTAETLQAICDLDLRELQDIEPPRGFGRDQMLWGSGEGNDNHRR